MEAAPTSSLSDLVFKPKKHGNSDFINVSAYFLLENLVLIAKLSWPLAAPCAKVYHGCPIPKY